MGLLGQKENMVGLCATSGGCPLSFLPSDLKQAEKAYKIRPSGSMRVPPIAFALIALRGVHFLLMKVFPEGTLSGTWLLRKLLSQVT